MRAKDIPPHLHERYGIRPPSPLRWVSVAVALVVAVPTGLFAASRYVSTQQVPFALISWSSPDEHSVQVLWKLDARASRQWCIVRAQDFDHFDVGFAVVPVGAGKTSVEYRMATLQRPLAVEVEACATDPYTLSGPQFRPGVAPPRQAAPGLAPGVYDPALLALR